MAVKVGFLVAGIKGLGLLNGLQGLCETSFVSSYRTKSNNDFYDEIKAICNLNSFDFLDRQNLDMDIFSRADIIFIAGWQFLIKDPDQRFIVFHDSILPRFRGFSPTVTALILGEKNIGVTALKLAKEVDSGEIYEQKSIEIAYPIKIKDAYSMLSQAYVDIAKTILLKFDKKSLYSFSQDESKATYSIWRDDIDYYVDWQWSAEKIVRFVDALGWPYEGAKTICGSKKIHIHEVSVIEDKRFEERCPGKIWRLDEGVPEVVCGSGIIRIIKATYEDGSEAVFEKLRLRFTSR